VYASVLADHHEIVRRCLTNHSGTEIGTNGDSFFITFTSPSACVAGAIEMQQELSSHVWPAGEQLRVRMGIHSGEAADTPTGLVGYEVHRAARIGAVAHGGQVLLSASAAALIEASLPADIALRDLGAHRLKDLGRPENLFQLVADGLRGEFPALRSLDNPRLRNNLPAQLTSFVGRDKELEQVRGLLSTSRLVTITGPGGCGKTRLALQVAADLLNGGGGVWFVDLAPLRDDRLVDAAVASALGLREEPNTPMLETIESSIADRALLLLLDNCEHLVEPCAKLADLLLRACPSLSILATSREPLGIDGEHAYRVPSLGVPPEGNSAPTASEVAASEAVQLLVERVRAHDPDFDLDNSNAPAVASICRRLDGIPLALELVAARLTAMSPSEVEIRLDDRFRLLSGGNRSALPRQQTLQASLDWSHDLLDTSLQVVLRRTSVFVGSFSLEAAEAVCAGADVDDYSVAELLRALVDRSMVRAETDGSVKRFRLGETVREYAARKLLEGGTEEVVGARDRHAAYFDRFGSVGDVVAGPLRIETVEQEEAQRRVVCAEAGNIRAALAHELNHGGDPDRVSRLALVFAFNYPPAIQWAENVEYLERARELSASAESVLRAKICGKLGSIHLHMGRTAAGRELLEEGRDIALSVGRMDLVIQANMNLSFIAYRRDSASAISICEEGVALASAAGDEDVLALARMVRGAYTSEVDLDRSIRDLVGAAAHFRSRSMERWYWECLNHLAMCELESGDLVAARGHFEDVLAAGVGEYRTTETMHLNLAEINLLLHDNGNAVTHWLTSATKVEVEETRAYYATVLFVGALCCTASGRFEAAATLHSAADQLVDDAEERFEPFEAGMREADLVRLRDSLSPDEMARAESNGRGLPFQKGVALAKDALGLER
jgi:predicted ATPase